MARKYAADPEWREKKLARDRRRQLLPEERARKNEKARERLQDPAVKERVSAYRRQYAEEHREQLNAKSAAWRAANPEKVAEIQWRYHQSEKGRITLRLARHRSRAKERGQSCITAVEWVAVREAWQHRCAYCDEPCSDPVLEHVLAVCLGGHSGVLNVVPACKPCNDAKADSPLETALERMGISRELFAARCRFVHGRLASELSGELPPGPYADPPPVDPSQVRDRTGEHNSNAKLTWERVREIRRLYADGGFSRAMLAGRFSVSEATVWLILNGQTWKERLD